MILNVFKKLTNPVLADGCPVGIEINLSKELDLDTCTENNKGDDR